MVAVAVADDYERNQLIDQVLAVFNSPDRVVRINTFEFTTVREALETASLFGGETIVVLDEADKLLKADVTKLQTLFPVTFGHLIVGAKGKSPLLGVMEHVFDLLEEKPWDKEKRLHELVHTKLRSANVSISADATHLFFDRLDKDASVLENELDKLLCYIGDKKHIDADDVLAITSSTHTATTWHLAEEIVWEKKLSEAVDETNFHMVTAAVRSQLQLGLKIASLLERNAPQGEWSEALPRVFAKTLEKRTAQAARFGSRYFSRGLIALFDMELRSRTGSSEFEGLFDWFRSSLSSYAPR